MPALNSHAVEHLTLPNGLQVVLCHAPRLKRCAAALRVAAGSHDVPVMWPGLAHFLEHLFFLGTEHFPAEENLMAFVQRHGGQVNASTRERTTDFFFELPQPVFAPGLERLCEMLAHPRMALADQLREREVLHAEFIAWSRDAEACYQTGLIQPLSAQHPLRAFHAGNRYSLPVPRQAFQQALHDFYQRFYQAGQMTLSLTGPQPLAELKALATVYGGYFAAGEKTEQSRPPPLLDEAPRPQPIADPRRLHLVFACEDLPESSPDAVAFFCTWLTAAHPGGLLFELRERGLIESLSAAPLYQFDRQLLLTIEFALSVDGVEQRRQITQWFFDWLVFFKAQQGWPTLREEYALLQQRRLAVDSALDLARHFSERIERGDFLLPLNAVLAQLQPSRVLHPLANAAVDHVNIEQIAWCLPEPNPFLRPAAPPAINLPAAASMHFSDALPCDAGEGAVFLRWRLDSAYPALWQMLNDSLKTLSDRAQHAGVSLGFSAYGHFWQLKLSGVQAPMSAIIHHALRLLTTPDSNTLARYDQASTEPALIPIRQLLKCLPDVCQGNVLSVRSDDLPALWSTAQWMGFAVGLSDKGRAALNAELTQTPGTPDDQPLKAPTLQPGKRWHTESSESSENAVLLFCPAPSQSLFDEAAWRLLAHLGQAPFYQRLRVELQLGYAVFSGFRQIAGQAGWLLGVQSPSASAEQIVNHLQAFIGRLPTLIADVDLPVQQQALAAQFEMASMDPVHASEWLWQAHLAGHDEQSSQALQAALLGIDKPRLLRAADQLLKASGGWLCLANRCSPGLPWLAAE